MESSALPTPFPAVAHYNRATTDEIDVNEPRGSQPGRVQVNPEEEPASRPRRFPES